MIRKAQRLDTGQDGMEIEIDEYDGSWMLQAWPGKRRSWPWKVLLKWGTWHCQSEAHDSKFKFYSKQ